MNRKYKIIQSFKLPIKKETLEEIEKTHKYISNKLILDAINGVKVVARDLYEVSKSRESFIARSFDGFSGASKKRQDLIDENLIEGLTACTEWLRDHDKHITRIDQKVGFIANELTRTQNEVLEFYSQHERLRDRVEQLREIFFEFGQSAHQRFTELEKYIKDIDIRTQAFDSLGLELSRLKTSKYDHSPMPLQIYTVLDNFTNGYGGLYYNSLDDNQTKIEFIERVENELTHYYNSEKKNYIDFETFIDSAITLQNTQKEALSYIGTQHYNIMLEKNLYPEISDLVSIVTSFEKDQALKEIDKQSNIRNFITYEEYIQIALHEHLVV